MDRKKKLGLLLVILIGICFFWYGIREKEEDKISASEEVIMSIESDAIKEISWDKDGVEFSFYKEEDTWYYTGDKAFPVNETILGNVLSSLSNVVSNFKIEEVENYAQYGLADPTCQISVKTDKTYTIKLGNYSTMDEKRYISIEDGNVYLLKEDIMESFNYSLSDFIKTENIPDVSDVVSFTLEGKNSIEIVYEEENLNCYSDQYNYFAKTNDGYAPLDESDSKNLINTINNLSWLDCATYNLKEDDLAIYGLDDPLYTIIVQYKEEEDTNVFTLYIGKKNDAYYARIKNSSFVYLIEEEVCTTLDESTYELIRAEEILLVDYNNVSMIKINMDENTYNITVEEEEYTLNNDIIDFTAIQEDLEALTIQSFVIETPNKEVELELEITQNRKGYETINLKFYQKDGDTCIVIRDGENIGLVSREALVDLKEEINKIVLN